MKRNDRYLHNRIWIIAVMLVLVIVSTVGLLDVTASVVALEQEARCGIAEHIHTAQCPEYCLQTVHSHNENCYLVLLENNDINRLLAAVDTNEEKSLETLISASVPVQAPQLTASSDQTAVRETEQAQPLLQSAAENVLVLNENLYDAAMLRGGPTDLDLPEEPEATAQEELTANTAQESEIQQTPEAEEESLSLLAVGDNPATGSRRANFYVYLDDTWVCIGTMNFTTTQSNRRYTARVNTSSMVSFVNTQLGTSFTRSDFHLIYATSANASSYNWTDANIGTTYTTFGTNYGQQSAAQAAKYIRIVDSSGDPIPFYTVTFVQADGTATSSYVMGGESVTLPDGYNWSDGTVVYTGGQQVEINRTVTFTAVENDGQVRIVYNIDFPQVSGVTVATKPTLYGTANTVLTDVIPDGASTVIRNVSQQEVEGKVDGNTTGLSRIIRFSGWRISGTDMLLSANSTLSWDELQSYANGSRLVLNGVWETLAVQTASFFVRYDSVAVDTNGNITGQDSNRYTPEIFATYVGGEDAKTLDYNALNTKYSIADVSADNSYTADQQIRALYGEQPGIWLQSFPEDDYIFERLKDYAQYLQVDGDPVDVNDLNSNTYTIRWYVFKCQSDAWHIDGRLVKKEGLMHVAKSFAGNAAGVARAKEGFYVEAVNASGDNRYVMTLEQVTNPENHPGYAAGTKFITPMAYDAVSDRYLWQLTGITYGEDWTITEHPCSEDTIYSTHSDWRVVDIFNLQNKVGYGHTVEVDGVTYATDAGTPEVLRVEYTNVYHTSDAIIIKKEDARTGSPLGGASFRLMQNGEPMRFRYNGETNQYLYDPAAGDKTELSGSVTGYYEIVVTGFSYDSGNIIVQEMTPPPGYTPVENITLGYLPDGSVGILSQSPMARYDEGLLVVQNTTESTSVTVDKRWLCPESDRADVTVQLLANEGLVSYLVPGVEPEKILTAANGYTATWDDLPIYANGSRIIWSVRETKIGSENCKADHTFANWIVAYSDPSYTTDENGVVTNTAFTIENDTRRTLLRLTKTNMGGGLRLADATFTLQHLVSDGAGGYIADPNFAARIMTTGSEGTLTFDNLLYGYYQLTEIAAPAGYKPLVDPIYLTITESGYVAVDDHAYAQSGTASYSVIVRNQQMLPLPATGGVGTIPFLLSGGLLLFGAALTYAQPFRKRKRGGAI